MEKKNYKLFHKKRPWKQILTVFFLLISVKFSFCTTPISVWPDEIKFNYEAGNNNDAVTLKTDINNYVTIPEFKIYVRCEKFAYIKGQSNRKIKVRFDSNCQSMHLLINLTVTSGTGIGTICNYFIANYNKLDYVTLTLNGTVPATVGKRSFIWNWNIYAIPNDASYCSATTIRSYTHTYYTLLDVPKNPMSEPWTTVLDYACVWASGQATELDVAKTITQGAYGNSFVVKKIYSGGVTHASFPTFTLSDRTINGIKYLGFLNDVYVDCRDMSACVQVFSNAIGVRNIKVRKIEGPIYYKLILPIGTIDWVGEDAGSRYTYWNFHQVGWFNNVYDACVKLNKDNPYIAVDKIIDGDNSYKTDLWKRGSWNPSNADTYTTVQ